MLRVTRTTTSPHDMYRYITWPRYINIMCRCNNGKNIKLHKSSTNQSFREQAKTPHCEDKDRSSLNIDRWQWPCEGRVIMGDVWCGPAVEVVRAPCSQTSSGSCAGPPRQPPAACSHRSAAVTSSASARIYNTRQADRQRRPLPNLQHKTGG